MINTLSTILCWKDASGDDRETCAKVIYSVDPGYAGDQIDPPYDASVEISEIIVTSGDPLDGRDWSDDDDLKRECMQDVEDDREAAAEYRAEMLADAFMRESL